MPRSDLLLCWGALTACSFVSACQSDIQVLETLSSSSRRDGGFPVTGGLRAQTLSAGQRHTCVSEAGAIYCWGGNDGGTLGTGDETPRDRPTRVGDFDDFTQAVAGDSVSCGRRIDGSAWCWGANDLGQAADPSLAPVLEPRRVDLPGGVVRLAGRFKTVCALLEDQSVWCWGDDYEGQLGQGDLFDEAGQPTPVPEQLPGNDWLAIDTGQGHTCGIRTPGELWCWGRNGAGELGLGSDGEIQIRVPTRVGGDADWVDVSAGQSGTCAIRVDGSLWCWGINSEGHITFEDPGPIYEPREVVGPDGWSQVSLNTFGGCGIRSGTLWCWGRGIEGQLGTGGIDAELSPVQVGVGTDWVGVAVGRFHTCARRADGTVWCTGENAPDRPLGVGDFERRYELTPVIAPDRGVR